ncbi:Hypothetical predicted protein [Mytilus galloprovincialis]|uniref:Nucleoporin NUP42 n=1 Tax=Mytilus galloprovincialis TaxID=29158 RepID=A0A8B6FYK2_MYTGA|nr:Hypothetical predicted protein [Mytilus galloprovincialis]
MQKSSKAICQFYKKSRGCKFGTSCRFLHSFSPDITQGNHNNDGNLSSEIVDSSPTLSSTISQDFIQPTEQNESVKKEVTLNQKDHTDKPLKVCHYFYQYGNCKFGTKCRFEHPDGGQQVKPVPRVQVEEGRTKPHGAASSNGKQERSKSNAPDVKPKRRRKPICQYYKAGSCKKGEDCRYRHVDKEDAILKDIVKQNTKTSTASIPENVPDVDNNSKSSEKIILKPADSIPAGNVIRELIRESASDEEVDQLRCIELQQLKKRFPKEKLTVLPKVDDKDVFQLSFSSSDPDWPYDVKLFELEIAFPVKYPLKMMEICLPQEQNLPETVRRYVEVSIQEWIEEKDKQNIKRGVINMVFRPFLKWFDRSLEDMVTEGLKQYQREIMAKAAGMEFIPASQLKKEAVSSSADDSSDETGSDTEEREFTVYKKEDVEEIYTGPTETLNSGDEYEYAEELNSKKDLDVTETEVRGTEVRLRNLQLRDSASTLVFLQIKIIIQCTRCHNRLDVKTPPNQVNAVPCQKCNQSQLVNFRPSMAHQYSSVIGYLDVEGCTAFDLVMQDCQFKLGCMRCSKETTVQGLPPEQLKDVSCYTCYQKMKVAADSVRFTELQPSFLTQDGAVNIPVMRIKKIPKDPRIILGNQLPDNGICRHYKKSFRWFRFPCCGKCYPCDVCHDDAEDHLMTIANRMICGHCCKEQPFALEKPCNACHQLMTKSRSAFWEGGKGCRDKTKMNRDDARKYANTNKTISRKAQEKAKPTKKKDSK